MTREVMGTEPVQTTHSGPGGGDADFDLGELRRASSPPVSMPREPLTVRLAAWRTRRTHWGRAAVIALVIAVVAGFAGWQVGGDHSRAQVEAWTSANPPLVGWIIDNGPSMVSTADDPREDVELHLLNVGRDPVIIRSISATSDGAPVQVDFNSYTPGRVVTGGTTIAALVLRTSCATEYSAASLAVRLTRYDAQGDPHPTLLTVAKDASLGQSTPEILNLLCAHPTRSDTGVGIEGLQIDDTSGISGATLTLTNTSSTPRTAEITSDESPAFQLVTAPKGPVLVRPGQTVEIRVGVRILKCAAIVGVQEWASSLTLEVAHDAQSLGSSGNADTSNYPLPDLVLVPGGAAIQKACGP